MRVSSCLNENCSGLSHVTLHILRMRHKFLFVMYMPEVLFFPFRNVRDFLSIWSFTRTLWSPVPYIQTRTMYIVLCRCTFFEKVCDMYIVRLRRIKMYEIMMYIQRVQIQYTFKAYNVRVVRTMYVSYVQCTSFKYNVRVLRTLYMHDVHQCTSYKSTQKSFFSV